MRVVAVTGDGERRRIDNMTPIRDMYCEFEGRAIVGNDSELGVEILNPFTYVFFLGTKS